MLWCVYVVDLFFRVADKITEEIHLFSLSLFHLAHTQHKQHTKKKQQHTAMKKKFVHSAREATNREEEKKVPNETK